MELKFTTANFEEEVLKSEIPVLVDFYADWCGPCKMMGPVEEKAAETYEGKLKVGKVNVEVKLPSESDKEIKPDIVISIDSRKGVLTGEVKNDSVKIDALELSLTDLDYEGKLGKWASRIPEKAKVTFEADEKAKFDEVQKTMDALSTVGVKFRMAAKERRFCKKYNKRKNPPEGGFFVI